MAISCTPRGRVPRATPGSEAPGLVTKSPDRFGLSNTQADSSGNLRDTENGNAKLEALVSFLALKNTDEANQYTFDFSSYTNVHVYKFNNLTFLKYRQSMSLQEQ